MCQQSSSIQYIFFILSKTIHTQKKITLTLYLTCEVLLRYGRKLISKNNAATTTRYQTLSVSINIT